jgi:hypothetical protein
MQDKFQYSWFNLKPSHFKGLGCLVERKILIIAFSLS